jgi:hypothetical protein
MHEGDRIRYGQKLYLVDRTVWKRKELVDTAYRSY